MVPTLLRSSSIYRKLIKLDLCNPNLHGAILHAKIGRDGFLTTTFFTSSCHLLTIPTVEEANLKDTHQALQLLTKLTDLPVAIGSIALDPFFELGSKKQWREWSIYNPLSIICDNRSGLGTSSLSDLGI